MPQLERPMALVSRPSPLVRTLRILVIAALSIFVVIFGVAIAAVVTAT